jgi:hypothetical protein
MTRKDEIKKLSIKDATELCVYKRANDKRKIAYFIIPLNIQEDASNVLCKTVYTTNALTDTSTVYTNRVSFDNNYLVEEVDIDTNEEWLLIAKLHDAQRAKRKQNEKTEESS